MNIFLELGSTGIRTLTAHSPRAELQNIQVSLAAPWQYTAAKTVSFRDKEDFIVDTELLRDLKRKAREQAESEADTSEQLHTFGIELIAQETINLNINGYHVEDPLKKKARELSFVQIIMLGDKNITETVKEARDRVVPKAKLTMTSFIFMFHTIMMRLYPHTHEACIIDITNEATEIGIIRDGALRFVSHIPVGAYTLARTIAEELSISVEEAFTYLKTGTDHDSTRIPEKHSYIVEQVSEVYRDELKKLLSTTGDSLSIPSSIFIHADIHTEQFFSSTAKYAAKGVTGNDHIVHLITSKLISDSHTGDTSILLGTEHWLQHVRNAS